MRSSVRAVAVFMMLAWSPAAAAADPASVYSDYAQDRVLSCTHSHEDLEAVLTDATLNQYGDPYTLVGLKLAVRRQLAGSCERAAGKANDDDDDDSRDGRMRLLGAGLLLLTLGSAGWAAKRAFSGRK
jgi:hypothetical protein